MSREPTWHLQHLHSVQQRRRDGGRRVCGRNEKHLRQVKGHVQEMVGEAVVLLGIQDLKGQCVLLSPAEFITRARHLFGYVEQGQRYLQQSSCRIPLQALPQFVHLIQEKYWVVHADGLQTIDDASRHAPHICASGKKIISTCLKMKTKVCIYRDTEIFLKKKYKKKNTCVLECQTGHRRPLKRCGETPCQGS